MATAVRSMPLTPQDTGSSVPSHYSSTTHLTAGTNAFSAAGTSLSNSTLSDGSGVAPGWKYRQPAQAPHAPQAPRLAKIKSSPGQGALAAARQVTTGARLHKRAGSTSAVQSPPLPSRSSLEHPQISSPLALSDFNTSPVHTKQQYSSSPLSTSGAFKPKTKLRPLLKRLKSQEETNGLDLSRSAADNEGLGIYSSEIGSGYRNAADVSFNPTKRGPSHYRSTSGASQFSTTTTASGNRQYVHPMRQTPRPYTPPIAHSYQNSILGSDHSADGTGVGSDEEEQLRRIVRDASYRGGPAASPSANQAPLRIHTNLSSTRLVSDSQLNLSATPASVRPRADGFEAMSPADTITPISRQSMERGNKNRSRTISDPASRAESIRAARQAFSEKEAARARKAEEQERKAAEKQERKREKRQGSRSRTVNIQDPSRPKPIGSSGKADTFAGREYSTLTPNTTAESGANARENVRRERPDRRRRGHGKSRWMSFMIWLKTRLFRFGRKVSSK
ncbi:MAG: hypothetical protein M1817_000401 [Caeruleum heppii]|nr:MAG: hypothetical protein M1817_000401 [Caeruleum heppii]